MQLNSRFLHTQAHREAAHIPLIVHLPGDKLAGRVKNVVSLIDIAPTVLAMAGVEPAREMQGVSLFEALGESRAARGRTVLTQQSKPSAGEPSDILFARNGKGALRTVKGAAERLYIYSSDPAEQSNALAESPRLAGRLEAGLRAAEESSESLKKRLDVGAVSSLPEVPADVERLKSLGYL